MPPLVKAARAHDGASAACVKSKIVGFASEKLRSGGRKSVWGANAKSKTMAPFEYRIPRGKKRSKNISSPAAAAYARFSFPAEITASRAETSIEPFPSKRGNGRACAHNYFYRRKKSKSGAGGTSSACRAGALAKAGYVPSV